MIDRTDPIIARIFAEPDVREFSFLGEPTNFHLADGLRRIIIRYPSPFRLFCRGFEFDAAGKFRIETLAALIDEPAALLAALESALAWLHGQEAGKPEAEAETWRDRPSLLR